MKTTKSPATYAARINNALRDAGISPYYRPFSECERLLREAKPEKFATIKAAYTPNISITATPAVHAVKPLRPSLSEHDSSPNGCHEDCPACAEERAVMSYLKVASLELEHGSPLEAASALTTALKMPMSNKCRRLAQKALSEADNGSPTEAGNLVDLALDELPDDDGVKLTPLAKKMAANGRRASNKVQSLKVIVEVTGGCAEVTTCPEGVEVEIIDHDNAKVGN